MSDRIETLLEPAAPGELSQEELKKRIEALEEFSAMDFLDRPLMKLFTFGASAYVGLLIAGIWACGYLFGWDAYSSAISAGMQDNLVLRLAVWLGLPLSLLLPTAPYLGGKVLEGRCRRQAATLREALGPGRDSPKG